MTLSKSEQIAEAVKAESEIPRIGKVKFYGICRFCGKEKIDVTSKLDFNEKVELVNNFGIRKVDGEWVCEFQKVLETCPYCDKLPF